MGDGRSGSYKTLPLESPLFVTYYKRQGIVREEEWPALLEALRRPLPVTFRINSQDPQGDAYVPGRGWTLCAHRCRARSSMPCMQHGCRQGVVFMRPPLRSASPSCMEGVCVRLFAGSRLACVACLVAPL